MTSSAPGRAEYHAATRSFVGTVPLVMGTRLTGMIVGTEEYTARAAWSEATALVGRLERMLNRFDPASEVGMLNAACDSGPVPVSPELEAILASCREYRIETGGLFDITKGGGSFRIDGDGHVDLCGCTIDFGGFAKGFFLRKTEEILKEHGVKDAFVCFGNSSILAFGHHPYGDCWKVSVTDPFTGNALTERDLKDSSLSVSGNRPGYEGHITDPRSGRKIAGRRVAVVTAGDPLDAEVLSTVAMIAGAEEMKTICSRFEGSAVQIYNDQTNGQ